jgi:hypothetical protein
MVPVAAAALFCDGWGVPCGGVTRRCGGSVADASCMSCNTRTNAYGPVIRVLAVDDAIYTDNDYDHEPLKQLVHHCRP